MPTARQDHIRQLDIDVARIENGIVALVKQRAELKRKRNALAPAVDLPPEVLAYIFDLACSAGGQETSTSSPHTDSDGSYPRHYAEGPSPRRSRRRATTTPLLLGSVCTAWRDVAWRASQLWTNVAIRLRDRRAKDQASLLQQYLQRSQNRLLRVKLMEDDTDPDEDEEDDYDGQDDAYMSEKAKGKRRSGTFNGGDWGIDVASGPVMATLAMYSQQWEHLDIFVPFSWRAILENVRYHLPNLTTLTLHVAEGSPTLATIPYFQSAPKLRDVTLTGYSISDVDLPWTQLRRFVGEYFSAGECLTALVLCSNLEYCQFEQIRPSGSSAARAVAITGSSPGPSASAPGTVTATGALWSSYPASLSSHSAPYTLQTLPPLHTAAYPLSSAVFSMGAHAIPDIIYHTNLRSLELVVHWQFDLEPLFARLILPSLEHFVLSIPDDSETSLLACATPLFKRSHCPLRYLHLVGITPSEEDLVECLNMVPTLETLYLMNPILSSEDGDEDQGPKFTARLLELLHPVHISKFHGWTAPGGDALSLPLLPNLRELEYSGSVGFQTGNLVDLISARWAAAHAHDAGNGPNSIHPQMSSAHVRVARLESVVLNTRREMWFQEEHRTVIRALRTQGLKFEVHVDP